MYGVLLFPLHWRDRAPVSLALAWSVPYGKSRRSRGAASHRPDVHIGCHIGTVRVTGSSGTSIAALADRPRGRSASCARRRDQQQETAAEPRASCHSRRFR